MNKSNFTFYLFFGLILVTGLFTWQTKAATRTVDNLSDDIALDGCTAAAADCSLRGAIWGAAAGDTINFASPLFDTMQIITLDSNKSISINKNLTIIGRGARLLTVRRNILNLTSFGIFRIGNATVTLSGMSVTGGSDNGIFNEYGTVTLNGMNISGNSDNAAGGGVYNYSGTMTILNSLISSNSTGISSAGVANVFSTMTIANTTIANNTVTSGSIGGGGGIGNFGNSLLNLNNVTITGNVNNNSGADSCGGIENRSGSTTFIRNTIVSGNSATNGANEDICGDFISNGYNLIGTLSGGTGFDQPGDITGAAQLGALQNNGGQTNTLLPTSNSPAVNAGNSCVVTASCGVSNNNPPVALTYDQRNSFFYRQNGAAVDIGAAELQLAPTAAGTTVGGRVAEGGGRGIFRVLVTMTDSQGNQRTTYTNQQGYYQFADVVGGQVYVFTAQHRRYQFEQPTQVQFIGEEENSINFIGTTNGVFRFDIWNLPTMKTE